MKDGAVFRYLIWDLDGTLLDTYPAFVRAYQQALADLGITELPAELDRLARISLLHCEETLAVRHHLDSTVLRESFLAHYTQTDPAWQPPFPGVIDVCERVVTAGGQNFIFTHRGRASLERLLTFHEMKGLFTDCVSIEEGYPRKPDPAAVRVLIERHRLPLNLTLAIGDRTLDILAGQRAGISTCFFGAGALEDVTPDYAITSYAELADVLFPA